MALPPNLITGVTAKLHLDERTPLTVQGLPKKGTPPLSFGFTVPGVPVGQPRQRHRIVGKHVQNYTPTRDPVNTFKAAVQSAFSQTYGGEPFDVPVRLSMVFVLPRPKSLIWKTKPMPRQPDGRRPDLDNLSKAVMDSLNGIAFRDDSLVAELRVYKWIASGDEQPYTYVSMGVI